MNKITSLVPLSFLLGFFVSTVLSRWWQTIGAVPWMTSNAFNVMTYLHSPEHQLNPKIPHRIQDKHLRSIRLTIMRYMNLVWILAFIKLSRQVQRRFRVVLPSNGGCLGNRCRFLWKCAACKKSQKPALSTQHSLRQQVSQQHDPPMAAPQPGIRLRLDAINRDPVVKKFFRPLITPEEIRFFEDMEAEFVAQAAVEAGYNQAKLDLPLFEPDKWIPLAWAVRILNHARELKLIRDDRHFRLLCKMINDFRGSLGSLSIYNEFNMPFGYTQVVTFAVYSYFLSEIVAQQYLFSTPAIQTVPADDSVTRLAKGLEDLSKLESYIPFLSILKFVFYLGWFKMGLVLLNPLSGERESEFPISKILDCNLQVSTQCAPSDDVLFPDYLRKGTVNEQIVNLHRLTKLRYDLDEADEPGEYPLVNPDEEMSVDLIKESSFVSKA